MIQGSCLCLGITFEFDETEILLFNKCYCSNCQKSSGTGSVTQLQVAGPHFHWIGGQELISTYESSPGIHRPFCKTCGSRVPQPHHGGELVAVPAGLLEDDPGIRPEISMHTSSKAKWDTIDESIPSTPGQGSDEFWREFMEQKSRGS
jgi:hypothetical protein